MTKQTRVNSNNFRLRKQWGERKRGSGSRSRRGSGRGREKDNKNPVLSVPASKQNLILEQDSRLS